MTHDLTVPTHNRVKCLPSPEACRLEFTDGRLSAIYTGGAYDQVYVVDRLGISAAAAADLYRPPVSMPPCSLAEVIDFTNEAIRARAPITDSSDAVASVTCNLCARHLKLQHLGEWTRSYNGSVDLSHNYLESLDWNVAFLHGDLYLHANFLKRVDGLPRCIFGDLDLRENVIEDWSGFGKVDKITGTIRLQAPELDKFEKILPILNVEFGRLEFSRTRFDGRAWVAIENHVRLGELDIIENILNAAGTGRTAMLRAAHAISQYCARQRDHNSGVCPTVAVP